MSLNPTDVANALKTAIASDADLDAWTKAAFDGKSLTVKRGYYSPDDVPAQWFPGAVIRIGRRKEDKEEQTVHLEILVTTFIDVGRVDPETGEDLLIALTNQIIDLFEDPEKDLYRLGDLVTNVRWLDDGPNPISAVPRLYRDIVFSIIY